MYRMGGIVVVILKKEKCTFLIGFPVEFILVGRGSHFPFLAECS